MDRARVGRALDDQREHLALARAQGIPAAGQARQVHRRAVVQLLADGGHCGQLGMAAPAHGVLEHGHAAAEKDAEAVAGRGLIAADAHVAAETAQHPRRHQADAQPQAMVARRRSARACQFDARLRGVLRRHHQHRAVAAEQEGNALGRAQVLGRGNRHGGDEVHRLVSAIGNGASGIDDVGHGQRPVVGGGAIVLRIEGLARVAQHRQAVEEARQPGRGGNRGLAHGKGRGGRREADRSYRRRCARRREQGAGDGASRSRGSTRCPARARHRWRSPRCNARRAARQ